MKEVAFIMNDRPTNDFSVVATTMHANLQEALASTETCSSSDILSEVRLMMAPHDFWARICPSHTVDVGFSFVSVHWMSTMPEKTLESASSFFSGMDAPEVDRTAWKQISARFDFVIQ